MRNIKGPRFQQRHYEAIAEVFTKSYLAGDSAWLYLRNDLAAMFKADNPKFKPERFKAACEPKNKV